MPHTVPQPAGSDEVALTFVFSIHWHGSSKRAARRWSPQRAGARLLVRVSYWSEAQLRWRLRDRGDPRRERAACRLEEEPAKANSYAVWKCKGKGDGGCGQASGKAALAATAHLDKTVLSATISTS